MVGESNGSHGKPPVKVIIIGSGPTAIGAAIRLHELITEGTIKAEVTILEAADRVGGLAASVTSPRGFTWDLGVHVTGKSKYIDFLTTIDNGVEQWNHLPRCVLASMRHVFKETGRSAQECYVPYPVQESVDYFPEEIRDKCREELKECSTRGGFLADSELSRNFAEFAKETFGETLTQLFIRPYNEKVWTVHLEEMSSSWAAGRVPPPASLPSATTETFAREGMHSSSEAERVRSPVSPPQSPNREEPSVVIFRYPKILRGVGAMWKKIVNDRIPSQWIQLNSPVVSVQVDKKTVAFKLNL